MSRIFIAWILSYEASYIFQFGGWQPDMCTKRSRGIERCGKLPERLEFGRGVSKALFSTNRGSCGLPSRKKTTLTFHLHCVWRIYKCGSNSVNKFNFILIKIPHWFPDSKRWEIKNVRRLLPIKSEIASRQISGTKHGEMSGGSERIIILHHRQLVLWRLVETSDESI